MKASTCVLLGIAVSLSTCVDFITYTANRGSQNVVPANVIPAVQNPSFPTGNTTLPVAATNPNKANQSIAALQARIAQLKSDNLKLKGMETCKSSAWAAATTAMSLSRATLDLNTCNADLAALKSGGKISTNDTLFNTTQMQKDNDNLNQVLNQCKSDVNAQKQAYTEGLDKFKAFKTPGLQDALMFNDSYGREIENYFKYQLSCRTLMLALIRSPIK